MIKKKYGKSIPVQLTQEWRDRVQAVADHPRIEDSMASVIRDCIETALPGFEMELGLVEPEEEGDRGIPVFTKIAPGPLPVEDRDRLLGKEDRSAGCFGGPPRVE